MGCSGYSEFTLPPVSGGDTGLTFALDAAAGPVIVRGADSDVLNPSVVRDASGYLNYYSAFDGKVWRTVMSRSADGLRWEPGTTVLRPDAGTWEGSYIAANGSALLHGGTTWQWYEAGPKTALRIGLARNSVKEPRPVLQPGPYMSWDERDVADPYVIRAGGYFYMYYLGQDRADPPRQRIGVARSTDGIRWSKLRTNPVLELGEPGAFDEADLGEPAVWNSHGFYWMLYTGTDLGGVRRLGLARSNDGVRWQKMTAVFSGSEPWDSKAMCDASVVVDGQTVRVWFGGGDVASPDEGLHGQIGYGTLRPVRAGEKQ
jgi:predicted GH43/DUF377 family glycosyl hydrolase